MTNTKDLAARLRWLADNSPPSTYPDLVQSWKANVNDALRQVAAALEAHERGVHLLINEYWDVLPCQFLEKVEQLYDPRT